MSGNRRAVLSACHRSLAFLSLLALAFGPLALPSYAAESGVEAASVVAQEEFHVIGTLPLRGERLGRRIALFFDAPLSAESIAGADDLIEIRPNLPHSLRAEPHFLVIDFRSVPEFQIVRVRLKDELISADGRAVDPAQREWAFANFIFGTRELWMIEETDDSAVIGVRFTSPVLLESLRGRLVVNDAEGQPIEFDLGAGADARSFRLTLPRNRPTPYKIVVQEGLEDASSVLRLNAPISVNFPPDTRLTVEKAEVSETPEGALRLALRFSHAVRTSELAERLRVTKEPGGEAVSFSLPETESSGEFTLDLSVGPQDARALRLVISQGLNGAGLSVLASAYNRVLELRPRELMLADRRFDASGAEPSLTLRFNVPVDEESLRQRLRLTPEIANMRVQRRTAQEFLVTGAWAANQTYTLTIEADVQDMAGAVYGNAIEQSVLTGEFQPYLSIGLQNEFLFPRRSGMRLPLYSRKLSNAQLTLHRVFPSNLIVALDSMRDGRPDWSLTGTWSEQVARKTISMTDAGDRNVETAIELKDILPADRKGVFCLQAQGQRASSGLKLIIASDIGLLSHWQDDQLIVFVHDVTTMRPLAGARVNVYSIKNQLIDQAHTDAGGIARMEAFPARLGPPRAVVVEHGDDFSFLELQPRYEDSEKLEQAAPPYNRKAYDAFLYADRELYRPGDTARLRWIVRVNDGDAVRSTPLLLHIAKPNGKTLLEQPVTLSESGAGGYDVETRPESPTGRYTASLRIPGSNQVIGEYGLLVEEFVPARLKTAVRPASERWIAGVEQALAVVGTQISGGPAANRMADAEIRTSKVDYPAPGWEGFRFGNDEAPASTIARLGEQQTDAEGRASFTFTYRPGETQLNAPLRGEIAGRVYEWGGRPAPGAANVWLFPSETLLGLAASPKSGGAHVEAAAIHPNGTPAALSAVHVTLERRVWSYYVRRYSGYNDPRFTDMYTPVDSREVALADGRGAVDFDVDGYGEFRVRVHSDETPQFSAVSFYSWGGECHIIDPARPDLLKITLDKPVIAIGETATARVESPYDGRLFVVLQSEGFHKAMTADIRDGAAQLSFEVDSRMFPNVWLEATAVYEPKEGAGTAYPFSTFSAVMVKVDSPRRRLDVRIPNLPEEIQPLTRVAFDVEVLDAGGQPVAAEVTLAAVDEGIHSMTGYMSPDPLGWLMRPRRPDLRRAHYYDRVAFDFIQSRPGGDGSPEFEKRIGAADPNWIRTVSLWSGVVTTDANGHARVEFDVPEYSGQLRLDAVAWTNAALGAASASVFVRRPCELRVSLPRFTLPGDTFKSRAIAMNRTGGAVKAFVSWTATGALAAAEGSAELDIPANGEAPLNVDFAAGEAVGPGEIRFDAVFHDADGNEIARQEQTLALPARPPASFQSHFDLVVLKPGESRRFVNEQFLDNALTELEIVASADPLIRLHKAIEFVSGYPYGCVEQTTSKLMTLLLARESNLLAEAAGRKKEEVDDAIRYGVDRLFAVQIWDGGLGMWPGAGHSYSYGSLYALHVLTLLEQTREFNLPREGMNDLRLFAKSILRGRGAGDSYSDQYERAYAVFVLALGGDAEAIAQIDRFDGVEIPQSARMWLAAALARATGDMDRVKRYLSRAPVTSRSIAEPDGTLMSDIRARAIELMALRASKADPAEINAKANELVAYLGGRHYGTTQETAFICAALFEYLRDAASGADSAQFSVAGPDGAVSISGRETARRFHEGPGGFFEVTNDGPVDVYVYGTTRGVPEAMQTEAVAEGVGIQRTIYSSDHEVLEGEVRHMETCVVRIRLDCRSEVKNLILVDLLPAGFEVVNARLDGQGADWTDTPSVSPTYVDLRDDRVIVAFDSLGAGVHDFHYVVSAVTPGQFVHPPAQAECMYQPEVHGWSASGRLVVVERE